MPQNKLLSSLGLCVRAGAVVFGTPMVCEALAKPGKVCLVLESADTSAGTHKRLTDKCAYYGVRHVRLDVGGVELAAALGKHAHLAAVALTDARLCDMVSAHIAPESLS
jgi:ribosomal protein L7Ae-like RNA K-turn-binding protein